MGLKAWLETRPPPGPVLQAGVWGRSVLRRAREAMLPPHVAMIERTLSLIEVRLVGIAAELNLAETIAERPLTSSELAAAVNVNPDALNRLLILLGATGCFRVDRAGRWRNNSLSSVLRDGHPSSVRAWARFFGGGDHMEIWAKADHSIATGRSSTLAATGHDFFSWASEAKPGAGERFDEAMDNASAVVARSFAAIVDFRGVGTICDIGGGSGRLLSTVLAAHPTMRGILFDLPSVIGRAADRFDQPPLKGRIEFEGGSFFDRVPTADRLVLVSVLHDWDDDRATQILRICRSQLPPRGRILVVESTLDASRRPVLERHLDILMLVLNDGGRERTREDFDRLFVAARLRVTRSWLLASLHTVYELEASPALDD